MSLVSGTKLGPYEILSALGAGGMGEVYKAKDARLERVVALKVLPEDFFEDNESIARFEREARMLASLNHPSIAHLYSFEEIPGSSGSPRRHLLSMELADGETLAERLLGGPLSLDQALKTSVEIASALDAAHRAGIIHRDVKPGNVMLTKSGAKLLDFGLAKAAAPLVRQSDLTSRPTELPKNLTQKGTILGTVQYMAPEQLEGKEADARTDIFAFGAVLYEMATGKKAFSGTSQAALISAILRDDPKPVSVVQPMTPPALDRVVKSCLAKDPEDRWQSAGDVAKELKWIAEGSAAGVAAPTAVTERRKARERLAWFAALLLVAAGSALLSPRFLRRSEPPLPAVRFEVPPPAGGEFLSSGWLSPDGRSLVFGAPDGAGTQRVWIRSLDSVEVRPMDGTGDVGDMISLAWSPDGRSLALAADRKIKRLAVSGGTAQPVCTTQTTFGVSWGASGVLVFVPFYGSGVVQVPAAGGTPSAVTSVDRAAGEVAHLWPRFLPDGRRFLFFTRTKAGRESHEGWITFGSLDEKGVRRIRAADGFVGVANGYLIFTIAGTLYAQSFDTETLTVRGEPSVIPGRARQEGSIARPLVEAGGTNLVLRSDPPRLRRLVFVDRSGRKLSEVGAPEPYSQRIAISPDGRRAVVGRMNLQRGQSELWVLDLERGTAARSGSGVEEESFQVWSPDGERFLLDSDREGPYDLVIRRVDGSSADEIVRRSEFDKVAEDWSRDGRIILFRNYDPKEPGLEFLTVGSKGPPIHVKGSEQASDFRLSQDGRWILWTSAESGRREVYVQRFPDGSARQQVSVNGGASGRWSPDGREILFVSPDAKLMAASFDSGGGSPRISIPNALFPVSRVQLESGYIGSQAYTWDVSPDGKKFLLLLPVSETDPSSLTVVLNWTAQLTQ
jgi:eukaryotic-like serine/threonine-protein kinase